MYNKEASKVDNEFFCFFDALFLTEISATPFITKKKSFYTVHGKLNEGLELKVSTYVKIGFEK